MKGYQTNMFPIEIPIGMLRLFGYLLLVTWIIISIKKVTSDEMVDAWAPLWALGLILGGPLVIGSTVVFIAHRWSEIINFIVQYIKVV